jgi:hypothetical protein
MITIIANTGRIIQSYIVLSTPMAKDAAALFAEISHNRGQILFFGCLLLFLMAFRIRRYVYPHSAAQIMPRMLNQEGGGILLLEYVFLDGGFWYCLSAKAIHSKPILHRSPHPDQ